MNCPGCNRSLVRLQVQYNKEKKDVWCHPVAGIDLCRYEKDGIKVTTEVLDWYVMEKFQELVNIPEVKKSWWKRWFVRTV